LGLEPGGGAGFIEEVEVEEAAEEGGEVIGGRVEAASPEGVSVRDEHVKKGGRLRVVVVDVHGGKVKAAGRDDEARQVWHLEAGRGHAEGTGDGVADNVDVSLAGDVLDGEAEDDEGEV
jgi:hypothetical protein